MYSGVYDDNMPFLGGVIHQLRNWVGGIIGYSDLALASWNPVEMEESLAITLDLTARMTGLLDVPSRFRNEKPGSAFSGDLAEIGRDVLILTDNWLREKGLEISGKFENAPASNTDLALARLALLENIECAANAIPRGSTVEYRSGFGDGLPFVGFFTGIDPGEVSGQNILTNNRDSGQRCEFKIEESGEYRFMVMPPVKNDG